MAAQRVAIVGGGLAGLSAGLELKEAGYEVELFERARLLGGRATSFEVDGIVVDNGQHVYLACCTEFIRFVERIGMAQALYLQDHFDVRVFSRRGSSRLRTSRLKPPWQLIGSILRYRELSFRDKRGLARVILALALRPHTARPDLSFEAWLRDQRQSDAALKAFWEPFMVAALNAPLDRMSAADAAFVLSTAFFEDRDGARIGYSRVPLAQLMETAAAKLDRVHRSTAVLALEVREERVRLQTADQTHEYAAAIVAVSPRALARILGNPQQFGLTQLEQYRAEAIMDVHLWHDRGILKFNFAALIDSPVQWIFQKGEGYLCCSLSAAGDLVARPSAEVVDCAWREVRELVPQLRKAQLLRSAVTRNPEGTYAPEPGTARPGAATPFRSLAIAGSWTATGWPDTMESAVRSGIAAARTICAKN